MIDKRLVPYSGLKKEPFSGSHNGMRYMMRSDNGRDSTTFTVFVYPEPWCFEQTPEDQIESHTFDLSEEGLDLAITWLLFRNFNFSSIYCHITFTITCYLKYMKTIGNTKQCIPHRP